MGERDKARTGEREKVRKSAITSLIDLVRPTQRTDPHMQEALQNSEREYYKKPWRQGSVSSGGLGVGGGITDSGRRDGSLNVWDRSWNVWDGSWNLKAIIARQKSFHI